jgi:hypothetical protein
MIPADGLVAPSGYAKTKTKSVASSIEANILRPATRYPPSTRRARAFNYLSPISDVVTDGMAGVVVVCRRARREIGRQLPASVLQLLPLGSELKIQASGLLDRQQTISCDAGKIACIATRDPSSRSLA